MRQEAATKALLGGLAILIVLVGFSAWHLVGLDSRIEKFIQQTNEALMQVIKQTVTRADGTSAEISTTRNAGETLEDWQTRHDAAVDHFKNS